MKILTFGVFDYFHIGHLRLFENCKKHGDFLVVAVQSDEYVKKYKPDAKLLYNAKDRMDIIRALRVVDQVVEYTSVTPDTLEQIDFDVLALGEDHVGERFQRVIDWCNLHGKKVVYMKRTPGICSSSIKEELKK